MSKVGQILTENFDFLGNLSNSIDENIPKAAVLKDAPHFNWILAHFGKLCQNPQNVL